MAPSSPIRLPPQPAADEPDGGAAGAVQPVQVVDDDEQRAARCRLAEQGQRCVQHRQAFRSRAGAKAERDLQRQPAGTRETAQIAGQRADELVQAGEADVRLVLHPAAPDHLEPGGGGHLRRRGQQGRLADAGLARQQQRRAIGTGLVEKRPEGGQLAVAADQAAGPDVDVQHRRRPSPWLGVARSSDRCYAPGSPRSWAGTSIN